MVETVVSAAGLMYYRSELEEALAPAMFEKGYDLFSVRQQIREHTRLKKQGRGYIFGKDWNSALRAAAKKAADNDFGVARIVAGGLQDGIAFEFYRSYFLDDIGGPVREVLADMLEGKELKDEEPEGEELEGKELEGEEVKSDNDMLQILRGMLLEYTEKGSECEIPYATLFNLEVAIKRKSEISQYVRPQDRKEDAEEDYDILARRILHRKWAVLFNDNIGQILQEGKAPTPDEFRHAYERAGREAYALMPTAFENKAEFEAGIAEGFDYETDLEEFNAMYATSMQMMKELEAVRLDKNLQGVVSKESVVVADFKDNAFKTAGDTGAVLGKFYEALGRIREAVLSARLGRPYKPDDNEEAARLLYYSMLDSLGEKVRETAAKRIDLINEEVDNLRGLAEGLEKKVGLTGIGDEITNRAYLENQSRLVRMNEEIVRREAQLEHGPKPTETEYQKVLSEANNEINILLDGAEHPIESKDLDDVIADYERQADTYLAVWKEIAPLYAGLSLAKSEDGLVVEWFQKKQPSEVEVGKINEVISRFKAKNPCMTKEAFDLLMKEIRPELQKIHLRGVNDTDDRYEYYEELKGFLGDAKFVKNIASLELPNISMVDKLIGATFGYYSEGQINKEKTGAILDMLRHQELARKFFIDTFSELGKLLNQAGGRIPLDEELQTVYDTAIGKAHVVMPPTQFISVIEKEYPRDSEGMLTGKARHDLLRDYYWQTYTHEKLVSKTEADNWKSFVERCALPIQLIGLRERKGSELPSAEEFYGCRRNAAFFAFRANPKLAERAGINTEDDLNARLAAEERKEKTPIDFMKKLRKEMMLKYRLFVGRRGVYNRKLEELYLGKPGLVTVHAIIERYTPSWLEKNVLRGLRAVFSNKI